MKRILLVEDNLGDARLAQELLAESLDFESHVTCVGRVAQAVDVLLKQPIDLVLLDLTLPDSQGLEGLRLLQSSSQSAPIIVLSGLNDKALALEALKHGAQDYLIKGTMNAEALTRVVQYSIERKAAEVRYRSLVANIPGVVYRCQSEMDWSMVFVSSPFETLTGFSPDEFRATMGCRFVELIHSDDRERATRTVLGAVTHNQPYSVEYRIWHKGKTIRWVLDRGQGIGGVNGTLPSRDGVLFDVTEQKQMEEKVEKTDQQLRQARQFAAMGNLAGGVAHDFNNLITAINGFADLLLNEVAMDSRSQKYLTQIRKASTRGMTITQQLLALGQTNTQETTLVDLSLLITDMERMICLVLGSHRRVEIMREQFLGRVKGNPRQLEQVLLILAMNITEGRSEDARLQIETTSWDVSREDAELLGFVFGGEYVAVTLRPWSQNDPQINMPYVQCPVMPGSETMNEMGFGMATVLKIVVEHNGYFLVSRDDSRVREYKVVLPLVEIDNESLVFSNSALPSHRAGTETMLVVDDEESIRTLVQELLEAQGYRVLEASGGIQAIKISEQYKDKIDLLIADEVMPEMSGHELAARLVLQRPQLRVLPMSTTTPESQVDKKPFLLKPFTGDVLLRRIEEALNVATSNS